MKGLPAPFPQPICPNQVSEIVVWDFKLLLGLKAFVEWNWQSQSFIFPQLNIKTIF